MNFRRRKNSEGGSSASPGPQTGAIVEQELLMDNLLRAVGNLGFRQVLPSPISSRRVLEGDPELTRWIDGSPVEVVSDNSNLILSPSHFLNVFKRYLDNVGTRGAHVAKWFYLAPVVRVRAGELSIKHEFGLFILGEDSPLAAAQLIDAVSQISTTLGVRDFSIEVNSLGCKVCQKDYRHLLTEHFKRQSVNLCQTCTESLDDNPFVVWSCAEPGCRGQLQDAPQIVDFLDEECRANLMSVLETVDSLGITYALHPTLMVKPLREKVMFRVSMPTGILGEGGNFTHFSTALGAAAEVPLIGFLTNFERLWQFVPEEAKSLTTHVEVFMVPLGPVASRRALLMHHELQRAGIDAAESMLGHASIKSQLKEANERHSDITLIIGQKEALDETVILRDMRSGIQEVFASERIVDEVKKRLGK
ncbi:MAG: Histidine-tRNA ligase [Parcubacteria group bacterium GW2011_GWA2_51_12]|nr:MAG: Histidine-tRNA ligase [Parcubacteria group bacterium GW2011_GWA2_51_12]